MKTIKIKVYAFDELSEEAKENALSQLSDINVNYDWWQFVFSDAEDVGLEINSFDIGRFKIDGNLLQDMSSVIKLVKETHGEDTDTYKTASTYEKTLKDLKKNIKLEDDESFEYADEYLDLQDEFKHDLLEDYLSLLRQEYEWQTSEEAIIDSITANEYEFDEDGRIFRY